MGKKERMRKKRNKKPLPKPSPTILKPTTVDSNGKHHRHPDYPDDEDWPVTPDYYRLGPPPNDIFHDDVCSICFDAVSLLNTETYVEYTCCGKCMHQKCAVKLMKVQYKKKMYSCPMCRAQNVDRGSKIHIERLQQWSKRNKPWAQCALGGLYDAGYEINYLGLRVGLKKNTTRAFQLYQAAAEQGHHLAQCHLGSMYAMGSGTPQSDILSFHWFLKSAIQGYANSQYSVGCGYRDGIGVEKSADKAFKYYKLAADQKVEHACYIIGYKYEKGENVKQSDQLAFKYYKMSADAGHYKAQFNVGEFYYRGYITHKLIPPDTFRWNIEFEQSYTNARTYLVKAKTQTVRVKIEKI